MTAVSGIYQNGYLKLDEDYISNEPVKVIVTFLEEIQSNSDKVLSFSDFSFAKSQKILENFKGSFSDAVIEERRQEL